MASTDILSGRPVGTAIRCPRNRRNSNSLVVADWLKGGRNRGTVDALRAMFNDARRPHAGMLIDANPFANLGLKRSKGRKRVQPPSRARSRA
jgi:hypothetical protein